MSLVAAALLAASVGWWRRSLAFPIALTGLTVSATASAAGLTRVMGERVALRHAIGGWEPPVGIEYVMDHLSGFVVVVVTGVALLVVIASRRAAAELAGERLGVYYGLVLLLLAGLTGIVVTGDLFNLFVFLEIASLASYTLVFLGGPRAMMAGFRYLILGTLGGALYLLGTGFVYFSTGTLNMADVAVQLAAVSDERAVQTGAVLIFAGLGLKMALFPMHLWLPDVYTYAPASVSSLIAPVVTKVMAYAILRMFADVFGPAYWGTELPLGDALIVLGLASVVVGSAAAAVQLDLRRMLAYSSIGQVGMIAVGIGLASPLGFVAASLHLMNHAVMKAALFLVASAAVRGAGHANIARMNGAAQRMPITMAAFVVAGAALVGVPPAAGFFSKWYLAQAGIEAGRPEVVAVVLLSSLLTAVYVFRVIERAYLRPTPAEVCEGARKDPPSDAWIPMWLLTAAAVVLGIANSAIVSQLLGVAF